MGRPSISKTQVAARAFGETQERPEACGADVAKWVVSGRPAPSIGPRRLVRRVKEIAELGHELHVRRPDDAGTSRS